MSDEEKQPEEGKHAKPEAPKWPGSQDTGKEFDNWLAKSNEEAKGK